MNLEKVDFDDTSLNYCQVSKKRVIEVLHYFNEETGLNVMIRQDDNTFLSGWKLNNQQLENVKNRGAL